MTLRRRLLLVYLVVVLLSCTTVGVAVVELRHSRAVISDLERWQDIMLNVQRANTAFERETVVRLLGGPASRPVWLQTEEASFTTLLQRLRMSYPDFDEIRYAFNRLLDEYDVWRRQDRPPGPAAIEQAENVRGWLRALTWRIKNRMDESLATSQEQDERVVVLLVAVLLLTAVHLAIVGAILRRWLLRPLEQLGRQVAALGRGQAPAEPLVATPPEFADLAAAMEQARLSLDDLRRRLMESERMTTVGQLAAQLAHNLRNPLASIRAAAQVASKRGRVDDYAQKRLDEIIAAADRLARWVVGLTEFVRPRSTRLEPADVTPLLHHVRDALVNELSAKDLTFEVIAPPEGIAIPHEPPSLEQALVAVAVNAIEASPVGGRIVAKAEWVRSNADAPLCSISIADQGPGLPEGPPDQVFELSFTTKQTGMGIGLSLARQAVVRHGGTVVARANAGGGTVIEFRIPATRPEPNPADAPLPEDAGSGN